MSLDNLNFFKNIMALLTIITALILLITYTRDYINDYDQEREAKKEYQSVEVINKISDISSTLWLQNTNYILVVKANDGSFVSVRVDAPAYAVIESGDTIHMAFYQADSASAYKSFAGITKLTDIEITSED